MINPFDLAVCPGNLLANHSTYCTTCLRNVFQGKKVSHILTYEQPQLSEEVAEQFMENRKRISISGVQEKLSLILDKNQLRLTRAGEQGNYILKPIPRDLKKVGEVPANEHLTMQIAKQVFGISTAENALIFFKNGIPAYITKRFDIKPDGSKWGIEDFASLAGKSYNASGPNFKYESSYEELAYVLKQYVSAWPVEMEKYFSLVLFNFLFSNGDAHFKNFSVLETPQGDYMLSPAYDLINTRMHVDDTDFALDKGLFADNYKSEVCKKRGHVGKDDFVEFARRIGIAEGRVDKLIQPFLEKNPLIDTLIERSFLMEANKRGYRLMYSTKRNCLLV